MRRTNEWRRCEETVDNRNIFGMIEEKKRQKRTKKKESQSNKKGINNNRNESLAMQYEKKQMKNIARSP